MSETSVIIPTYNRASFLGQAIESVLRQTRAVKDILIIDDGSTDGTAQIAHSYSDKAKYYRKENSGKASSLNLALPMTTGENIWIIDDDDIVDTTAHETLLRTLEQKANCGFSFGKFHHFEIADHLGYPKESFQLPYHERLEFQSLFIQLMERCFVFQPGMLVKRSSYNTVGLFDETLARSQDYDMLLRLAWSFPGSETDDIVFFQRRHSGERGPAHSKTRYQDRESVWQSYDQKFFTRWHSRLPLAAYCFPLNSSEVLTPELKVTCLLQRLVLMGRKSLWSLATADLREVLRVSSDISKTKLTFEERRILRKLFIERPFLHLLDDEAQLFVDVLRVHGSHPLASDIQKNLIWATSHYIARFLGKSEIKDMAKVIYSAASAAGIPNLPSVLTAQSKAHIWERIRSGHATKL